MDNNSIVSFEELVETWWAIHSELEITKDSPGYLTDILTVAFEKTLEMCQWTIEEWNQMCYERKSQ